MHNCMRALLRPDGAGSHTMLGYLIRGEGTGPTLMLPLPRTDVADVADALGQLPGLANIRGCLALVNIGSIGTDPQQDDWLRSQIGPVDATFYPVNGRDGGMDGRSVQGMLRAIHVKATELGMLSEH